METCERTDSDFYELMKVTSAPHEPTLSGGEILFRAAACTGALYHIDLYLVAGDLPGLEAGVYHFGPHDFALRRLRAEADCSADVFFLTDLNTVLERGYRAAQVEASVTGGKLYFAAYA